MALMTKKYMNNLLKRILETGGLTDNMEKDVQALRDDFDEREGILKEYGEDYDGEEDSYEFKSRGLKNEGEKTVISEGDNYKEKYEDLHKKYIERFFGDQTEKKIIDEKVEGNEVVVVKDDDYSYDKLFEGDEE